jgi:hypothetical protein
LNKFLIILGVFCIFACLNSVTNFANAQTTNSTSTQDIVYTAKFVCGSISDDKGPLRPGHYDTSINILNKKSYSVGILWNAVINDGPASISIFRTLEPEKSTGFSCHDIKDMFGIETKEITEGFAIIKIPLASLRGFSNEQIIPDNQDQLNILDVQVFYTANALDTLPHEVAQEKIAFYIIQDGTGKIPKDSFRKLLDVTIPSTLYEVFDTEQKVKSTIAEKFDLGKKELEKIRIRIKSISVGVGALLDDHAVSLHVVKPQFSS